MAVFSSASRARTHPWRRLPSQLLLIVPLLAVIAIAPSLLDTAGRSSRLPALVPGGNLPAENAVAKASVDHALPGPAFLAVDEVLAGIEAPYVAPAPDEAILIVSTGGPALVAEVSENPPVAVGSGGTAEASEQTLAPELPADPIATIQRWAAAGIYVETDGQHLDAYSLANIDAALSVLPTGVLSNLGNPAFGPLHILVNTEGRTMSGDQPYRGPANFFSTNESTNELVLYPQQSVFTIVHELGHAYNLRNIGAGRYALVLLDPEMRSFLAAAGWQVLSSDAEIRAAVDHMHVAYTYAGAFHWPRVSHDDPLEDFANSFATFFLDPETLQQTSPERYEWMVTTFGR